VRAVPGSILLFCAIAIVFGVEIARGAVDDAAGLLSLGALPNTGQLHGEYWRLLTFGFLHANFLHLLLNTALIWLTGPVVERRAGTAWFVIVFLTASVVSGACILPQHLRSPDAGTTVGASGGLFALLAVALILLFRPPSQGSPLRWVLTIALVVGLLYSFLPGVSMVGHVSGLAIGAILALFIPRPAAAGT
jgi:membrane associated rhomboid family serine protease